MRSLVGKSSSFPTHRRRCDWGGYSLPNASVMASYRRGRRNGCSSRRGYLIGLGHNADISAATGVPCHRPNIMERAPNRIVSTIIIGKYFQSPLVAFASLRIFVQRLLAGLSGRQLSLPHSLSSSLDRTRAAPTTSKR